MTREKDWWAIWRATKEDVVVLKQGAYGVERWKEKNPGSRFNPSEGDFSDLDLRTVNLDDAKLIDSDFRRADLEDASFVGAFPIRVDFRGANLTHVNFEGANLRQAKLQGTNLTGANFHNADVTGVEFDFKMKCDGTRVETCDGSVSFKRTVQDLNYITEFSRQHPIGSWFWSLCTDYGRSFSRVAALFLAVSITFALVYDACPWLIRWDGSYVKSSQSRGFAAFYYSVTTLTTLGFGDISPANNFGAILVILEVLAGYFILGLLISMLADKVARRS
jgi:uncharacterized protein YjbI with pentapeptide repeats